MDTSTYRGYLQGLANSGDNNANALLQVVGDDGRVNDTFQSNGVNVGTKTGSFNKQQINDLNKQYTTSFQSPSSTTTNATSKNQGGSSYAPSQDVSFLNDQATQLKNLLGRTDTGLAQGLAQNEDQYNTQVGGANAAKDQAYSGYQDQRVAQNKGKQSAYDTINKNANTGYRSLAQIIGRAAGTGSSAFQDLLPNVIGTDTSSKRQAATDTYGQNLQGIDKSQNQYDINFQNSLADLLKQKKANEENIRSGVENQRQSLDQQLATNAGQVAQARGGGYAQVKAAQQPFQDAINNSRNAVESFFNQFRTPYTPTQAVAATPDLANYNVDRSNINTQGQQGVDPNNPYSQMLRKKLQGTA